MRRFLLTVLVLILFVSLAGALTGIVLQYSLLQDQARIVADLENDLRGSEDGRYTLEAEIDVLEDTNQSLRAWVGTQEAVITTLESAVVHPPIPTATPPSRPVVSITSPAEGEQFEEGEIVVIRWEATNQDRIGRVNLQVDGNASDEVSVDGSFTAAGEFSWLAAGLGKHVLAVMAANTIGAVGRPATVTIEVIPTPEQEPSLEEQNRDVMDSIEAVVIGLRGLEPVGPITRTVYTQDELERYVVQTLDRDYSLDEASRDAIEMAAFDFLPASTDLRELIEALYTEQIAGFYDSDTGSLAIITDRAEPSPLDKITYAHEFTHALQDQHYGLEALDLEDNSDDASMAVTALIEGDAMLVQEQYMLQFLDSDDLFELLAEASAAEYPLLDGAPRIVREQLMFPYEAGLLFVKMIVEAGGHEALDSAYLNPPQSTEQILHPNKYLSGEAPQPVSLPPLTATLGNEWQWVDSNVLGEFTLRLYLEQNLTSRQAAAAAAGWGGDRYAVYVNAQDDTIVMLMKTIWDADAEAAEFVGEYMAFGAARFGTAPTETDAGVCWTGSDVICVYQYGSETLIIRAPTPALKEQLETVLVDV